MPTSNADLKVLHRLLVFLHRELQIENGPRMNSSLAPSVSDVRAKAARR